MGDNYFTPIIFKVVSFLLVLVVWYSFIRFVFCVSERVELFSYEEAVDIGISFVSAFMCSSIYNTITYFICYLFDK